MCIPDDVNFKNKNIIVLPVWVYKALYSKGIDVVKLENIVNTLESNIACLPGFNKTSYQTKKWAEPVEQIYTTLSKYDVQDIIYANKFVTEQYRIATGEHGTYDNVLVQALISHKPTILMDYSQSSRELDFKNALIDKTLNKFIMSTGKKEINPFFDLILGDNCFFLILNSGFCNFTAMSNVREITLYKICFLKVLYNFIFQSFGEDFANQPRSGNHVLQSYLKFLNVI